MNESNIDDIINDFNCRLGDNFNIRVLKAKIRYDKKDPIRPLWIQDRNNKDSSLENLADCDNTRRLFNFQPEFTGYKNRTIIIIDE
mgnify:FL=1